MSRSLDREEEKPQVVDSEGSDLDTGLSRSGGQERPRPVGDTDEAKSFGENRRELVVFRDREYRVRPSETETLQTLGTFRVVRQDDLIRGVYGDKLALLVPGVRLDGDATNDQQRGSWARSELVCRVGSSSHGDRSTHSKSLGPLDEPTVRAQRCSG